MAAGRINSDVFREYANLYDLFYESKDYAKESAYILRLLRKHLGRKPLSVLDLGCGTGGHCLHWAAKGIAVQGIDRSAPMLEQAARKARQNRLDVRFTRGDIRNFVLGEQFDAVTAMFAVMSYQTRRKDVLAALRSVRRHLPAGGIFVFDVWYGPGVIADPPGERIRSFRKNGSEILRTVKSVHHPAKHGVDVYYDILVLKGKRLLHRIQERHSMRYFFPEEVARLASTAGFRLIDSHPFLREKKRLTPEDWNATFVLQAL